MRRRIFILLLVVSLGITLFRIPYQLAEGPRWDTFSLLLNGLQFAGMDVGYFEIERPPLLPLIESLFFRVGLTSEAVAFYVDALFYILAALALYGLLHTRFSEGLSFLGSLTFLTSPLILEWATTGYTDISSVAFAILAVYFLVYATEKNPRFFMACSAILFLAVMTRYAIVLIAVPILAYSILEMKRDYLSDFTWGIVIFAALTSTYFIYCFVTSISPLTIFSWAVGGQFISLPEGVYQPVGAFFFVRAPAFLGLGGLGYVLMGFIVLGLGVFIYNRLRVPPPTARREVRKGGEMPNKDLLFLTWLVVFFSFHSLSTVAQDRYFITIIPPMIYFLLLGIEKVPDIFKSVTSRVAGVQRSMGKAFYKAIAVILVIMMLASSVQTIYATLPYNAQFGSTLNHGVQQAAEWIENHEEDVDDLVIQADYWPGASWFLKKKVGAMGSFRDPRAFEHELRKHNADYYISLYPKDLKSYHVVAIYDDLVYLYKKNEGVADVTPRFLVIGEGWEHYIEDILDYEVYVKTSWYKGDGAIRLHRNVDDYTLEELQQYSAIFLYYFQWKPAKLEDMYTYSIEGSQTESLLLDYVKSGGCLIFDASGNIIQRYPPYMGVTHDLAGQSLFGVEMIRRELPEDPAINVLKPDLFPRVDTSSLSPFLTETGDKWFGMAYESLDDEIETLVTIGGDTLVGIQRIGEGMIIWIGYNYFFHASYYSFYYGNEMEKTFSKDIVRLVETYLSPIVPSPTEAAGIIQIVNFEPAGVESSSDTWVSIYFANIGGRDLEHFELRVTNLPSTMTVAYPGGAGSASLSRDHTLSVNEVDYSKVRLSTSSDYKDPVVIRLEALYVADGEHYITTLNISI